MPRFAFRDIASNGTEKKRPTVEDCDRYVGLEHLDPDSLFVTRWGADAPPAGDKLVMRKGDILFGKRRAYQRKIAIAPFDGIFSAHGMVLRPKTDAVDPGFFPFFLRSDRFMDAAIRISVGGLSPTINWKDLAALEFELPDLATQRMAAEKLWSVYRAKEAYLKLLAATDELVKSQFVEMFGDYGCQCKTLGSIFSISSSNRILKSEWKSAGIPFLRVRDMVRLAENKAPENEYFVSEEFYDSLSDEDGTVREGDFLVSATSTVGKIYTVRNGERFYYKDADILRFRKRIPIVNEYFIYAMSMPFVREQIDASMGATTVNHFLISKAKLIRLPVPPFPLQQHFANFVIAAEKSKFETRRSLERLDAVYRALLAESLG